MPAADLTKSDMRGDMSRWCGQHHLYFASVVFSFIEQTHLFPPSNRVVFSHTLHRIELSLHHNIPSSLLILSRAMLQVLTLQFPNCPPLLFQSTPHHHAPRSNAKLARSRLLTLDCSKSSPPCPTRSSRYRSGFFWRVYYGIMVLFFGVDLNPVTRPICRNYRTMFRLLLVTLCLFFPSYKPFQSFSFTRLRRRRRRSQRHEA